MKERLGILALGSALMVALLLGAGCSGAAKSSAAAAPTAAAPAAAVRADGNVTAEGKLVPQHSAQLSLPQAGVVAEVLVREGDVVQAGQPLLRLKNEQQTASVAQAQAALQRAQAQRDEQTAGARPQEITAAQAAVDAAQAQLDRLTEGPLPQDVAAAQAALAGAQADLQKAREGADPEALIAARADAANADAAVRQAQAAYDQIKGNPDAGRYPQSAALEQATNNLNAAHARLAQLEKGSTAATIAKAQAGVRQAQAELDKVQVPARPAEIAAAKAEVQRTQAQLDLLKAGSRAETVAAAEAAVASAQADLAKAQAALHDSELTAPFAGAVVTLDTRVGEQVAAGAPLVHLADLTSWQIETTDLTEINISRVKEGAAATLAFDAVPGLKLNGKVARIRAFGENRQGDMVYTVTVFPEQVDPRLRWNMTSQVTIQP
jgi:HlyD family secretion protein